MKYIELFAGIGGFRSALDSLGMQCVFASEIDKYAVKSYNALYGHEPSGDITKIDDKDIPDHDLLVGGFPCQAFSIAGQRKGFEDTRGTLFFEIARIAKAKRPQWLLLENVKGLLSHDKGNTFEVMCKALNEIGYAIDFQVLNSKHYGVPQNRERIFIVANRDAEHTDWKINGTDVVAKAKKRVQALGVKTFNFNFPKNNVVEKRLRDVLQEQVDEKFYLSKEKTAKLIHQLHDRQESEPQVNVIGSLEYYNFDAMNRVHDADGLSPTIQTLQGGSREPKIVEPFYATPEGLSYCLTTRYDNGMYPNMFVRKEKTAVKEGYRIRKLTPLECFRLQGFTDEQFQKCVSAGVSNSQLYKQAGNAVTVNVIQAIGKAMLAYDVQNHQHDS